jgi:hypothetical protein
LFVVYSIFANLGIYISGFVFPTGPKGPTGAESNDSSDLCRSLGEHLGYPHVESIPLSFEIV